MDARIALRAARPLQTSGAAPDHFAALAISPLRVPRPQPCRALPEAVVIATIDATVAASEAFEARVDPAIAVAAAVAAVPPILFWVRIVLNEQKRRREAEEKERARLVSGQFAGWIER
jgi:hypothetical protein